MRIFLHTWSSTQVSKLTGKDSSHTILFPIMSFLDLKPLEGIKKCNIQVAEGTCRTVTLNLNCNVAIRFN